MKKLYKILAAVNRNFNVIRPRRILYFLGDKAFKGETPPKTSYKWYTDKWGLKFKLSPYYYLDRQIIGFGAYETELCMFINKHISAGMTCFDLGANMGLFSVLMGKNVGPSGQVHSFEPIPDIHDRLLTHISENQCNDIVMAHELGVSDKNCEQKINFGDTDLSNQGMASLVMESDILTNSIDISIVKLDDFVKLKRIKKIDFMKFDIQGSEIAALEGAVEILENMRPILCLEVAPIELAAVNATPKDLLLKIQSFGYAVHEMTSNGDIGKKINCGAVEDSFSADNILAIPL